jgi:Polyketide cyclase / dehydrase and lipid transport
MPTHSVTATARIAAPAPVVYATIANYHTGHPRIVPKQFSNLVVEEGGIGAGTVIRFDVKILGTTTHLRAVVSEPEPGRVLVERNVAGNEAVSTFVVDPDASDKSCQVTIHTEMPVRDGLAGVIEKFMLTRVLTSIYEEELKRLEAAAQQPA